MLLLLLACAPKNSCAEYAAAAADCVDAAGGDPSTYAEETVCGEWSLDQEASYGDWYQCRAEAWRTSACETTDDIAAAVTAESECPAQ